MEECQVIFQPSLSLLFLKMSWWPSSQTIRYIICPLVMVFALLILTRLMTGLHLTWNVMSKLRCVYQMSPYYTQLECEHYFICFMYVFAVFILQYQVIFFLLNCRMTLVHIQAMIPLASPFFVELCPNHVRCFLIH